MLFDCRLKILHKHCLQFLLGVKMAPRETENNAYAKFLGDKQRALWYVMVFLEWSIVVNLQLSKQGIRWPVLHDRIADSGVDPSGLRVFLTFCADKFLVFNWSQAKLQLDFLAIHGYKFIVWSKL